MERREAPRVEIYPEPAQRVSTGQSVLFQCRVTAGIPNPVVRWTRPGGRSQFKSNVEIMDGGVIRYARSTEDENSFSAEKLIQGLPVAGDLHKDLGSKS